MELSSLARDVSKNLNRHSPTILTIIGVAGFAATAYFSHRAGANAMRDVMMEEDLRGVGLTAQQRVQMTWKHYIAPLSIGMATAACMITSNVVSVRRQTALIGAYTIAERAAAMYREKIQEQIGTEAEAEIRKNAISEKAAEIVKNEKVDLDDQTVLDNNLIGKAMFIDVLTGQMFITTLEDVYKAQMYTNKRCAEDGYASMNYFYSLVNGRRTELGEHLGWNTDRMMDLIISEVNHDAVDSKFPVFGIDYMEQPMMEYHRVV